MADIPDIDWTAYVSPGPDEEFESLSVVGSRRLDRLSVFCIDLQDNHTGESIGVTLDVMTGDLVKSNPAARFEITTHTVENVEEFRRAFDGGSAA